MNIFEGLAAQGIKLTPKKDYTNPFEFSCDCPQSYCKEARSKDDKTPLRVMLKGPEYVEWRCRNCLWSGHIGTPPPEEPEIAVPVTRPRAKQLPAEAIEYLAKCCITEDEAVKYQLSWDGALKAVKIPYFEGGKIINHALIRISDGKSKLENPNSAVFFNIDKLGMNSEPVIIAHRELDAILLAERGLLNVIGLPNGGNVAAKGNDFDQEPDKFAYLSTAARVAKGWGQVRFAFDDTNEGRALRQELARRLGPGRCASVKFTRCTALATMKEVGSEVLCEDVNDAKALPILGLFCIDDFEKELDAYFEHGMACGVPTGWPNVDKLYTVMPGQLTVVTGIPNSGKSEWVDDLSMNLAQNHGWRFAAFSPENGKEAHATKLIEKRTQQSTDPKAMRRMGMDTFHAGARWVNTHYTFIESAEMMPTLDWILDRARDATLRYGIKGLIIDPWNRIEKKLEGRQSETDYVAESLPKILRYLKNYDVHGWLVVHPKQQQPDHKTGKIRAPSLYDMAGSAHFVNMCDNGIVIHRSEAIDNATDVLVRKVRFKHVGCRGETKLHYDRPTGRYSQLPEQPTASQKKGAEEYAAASRGEPDGITTYGVD